MYSNMLRSFLDTKTLQLLAVRCAVEDGNDHFYQYKQLIERYEFLEHMSFETLYSTEKDALLIYISQIYQMALGKTVYLD